MSQQKNFIQLVVLGVLLAGVGIFLIKSFPVLEPVIPSSVKGIFPTKGSEKYCRQFSSTNCPSDCEIRPSCPVCMDIGCHAVGTIVRRNLNFQTINVSNFKDYAKKADEQLLINDVDSWEKIVDQPEIRVDFKNETVIAVFMPGMTGGYDIRIEEVVDRGNIVDAVILQTRPGENCIVTQALTFNSHVVKLLKISKAVNFIVQQETRDCKR